MATSLPTGVRSSKMSCKCRGDIPSSRAVSASVFFVAGKTYSRSSLPGCVGQRFGFRLISSLLVIIFKIYSASISVIKLKSHAKVLFSYVVYQVSLWPCRIWKLSPSISISTNRSALSNASNIVNNRSCTRTSILDFPVLHNFSSFLCLSDTIILSIILRIYLYQSLNT